MTRNSAKVMNLVMSAVLCAVLLQGCSKKADSSKPAKTEKPVGAVIVNPGDPVPGQAGKLPPPTMKEVEEAAHRVLGDNVVISSKVQPAFIVGDFNGDHVQDLAVAVEPVSGKLAELNNEFSNWIVQDADDFFLPKPNVRTVKMPEPHVPHVEAGDVLLEIIHGFGPQAWRNPQARQVYLVRHAANTFLGTGRSFKEKYIREMKLIIETDVIKEDRGRKSGFIFWTGSNYAWHSNNG